MKSKEEIENKITELESNRVLSTDLKYSAEDAYITAARIAILKWVLESHK